MNEFATSCVILLIFRFLLRCATSKATKWIYLKRFRRKKIFFSTVSCFSNQLITVTTPSRFIFFVLSWFALCEVGQQVTSFGRCVQNHHHLKYLLSWLCSLPRDKVERTEKKIINLWSERWEIDDVEARLDNKYQHQYLYSTSYSHIETTSEEKFSLSKVVQIILGASWKDVKIKNLFKTKGSIWPA